MKFCSKENLANPTHSLSGLLLFTACGARRIQSSAHARGVKCIEMFMHLSDILVSVDENQGISVPNVSLIFP